MYETEANGIVESADLLPADVVAGFGELAGKILSRSVLPWSEHCTECVWPTCYTSCELYSPRSDGRCRRFVDGIVRVNCDAAPNGYVLKVRFKRWAKLWTPGSMNLHPDVKARAIEKMDYRLGRVLYNLPLPGSIKSTVITKRYSMKKRLAARSTKQGPAPTSFVVECYNPMDRIVDLSLTIRSTMKGQNIPYQSLFHLRPGFQRVRIPIAQVEGNVDLAYPFAIELIPSADEQEVTLYFGLMDFVKEAAPQADVRAKVKCVVWDLDNTLWDGVLVEDGSAKLTLKPGIREIIESLDQRGILQSVASKNNHDEAIAALKHFGLEEYFLYPQISWSPKGEAVRNIAQRLNIGIDTLVFVDDQEFERSQVQSAAPNVKVFDSADYLKLLDFCGSPEVLTSDGKNRRKLYQVEQARQQIEENFKDDYQAFLKHCDIKLKISPLTDANLQRVHELTQRTNQMNFSGNRYDRAVLSEIMRSDSIDTYVLSCEDRFGSYGIVGFAVVDKREPRLTDLMFSCRIQAKRVEHAFLGWVMEKYISATGCDFHANYRKTPRNAPSGQVFDDLGMSTLNVIDGVTSLQFARDRSIPHDHIIQIETEEDLYPLRA